MGNIKRSTARDFRINAASLEAALREIESEDEDEDGEGADENDGEDESVNGTLRTHQTNADNNNNKANRSSVKEVLS